MHRYIQPVRYLRSARCVSKLIILRPFSAKVPAEGDKDGGPTEKEINTGVVSPHLPQSIFSSDFKFLCLDRGGLYVAIASGG